MFSKNNRITDNSLLLHVVLGEQLIQLLQEKESKDGVRSDTEEVRSESLPQGENSLVLHQHLETVKGSLVLSRLCHLQTRFHDIHRQRHKTAEQTRGQRRGNVQSHAVRLEQMPLLVVQLLRLSIASQLSRVQHHCTHHSSRCALPQCLHSLLLDDAVDGLEAVRVASTLLGGQTVIGTATNQRHLGRITHHGSASTSNHSTQHLLQEGGILSIVAFTHIVHAVGEHSETCCRVRDLTKNTRGVSDHQCTAKIPNPLYNLKKPSCFVIFTMASKLLEYNFSAVPSPLTLIQFDTIVPQLHTCLYEVHWLYTSCRQYSSSSSEKVICLNII